MTVYMLVVVTVLFFVFTPFESPGSYISVLLPRFAILLGVVLYLPRPLLAGWQPLRAAHVLLLLMLFHLTVVQPTAIGQLVAEWAGFLGCVFLARLMVKRPEQSLRAMRMLLALNVIGIALQTVLVGIAGFDIDLHNLIFPTSEARTGVGHFGYVRMGGFQIEPGTYATWMAMLVACTRVFAGRFQTLEWIAIGSLMVTYSTAAAIYFVAFLVWAGLDALQSRKARSILLTGAMVIVAATTFNMVGIDDYLVERFDVNSSVGEDQRFRVDAFGLYDGLPLDEKVLGFGHTRELCDYCSFDDLGFAPNMLMRGGVFSLLGGLVMLFVFNRQLGITATIMVFLFVGSAKAATNAMAPWFVLLLVSEVGAAMEGRAAGRLRRARTGEGSRVGTKGRQSTRTGPTMVPDIVL